MPLKEEALASPLITTTNYRSPMPRGLIIALFLSFALHFVVLTADSWGLARAVELVAAMPLSSKVQVGIIEHQRSKKLPSDKAQVVHEQKTEELSSGQDQEPKLIGGISPPFPLASRLKGEEGSVSLSFSILADGSTKDISISKSSGFSRLDKAALEFIRGRRYQIPPSWHSAQETTQELTITYRLE